MNDQQKRVLREANTVCEAIHDPRRLGRERDALKDQLDAATAMLVQTQCELLEEKNQRQKANAELHKVQRLLSDTLKADADGRLAHARIKELEKLNGTIHMQYDVTIAQMEALLLEGLKVWDGGEGRTLINWQQKVNHHFPHLAGRLAETNSAPTGTSGSPEFDAWWLVLQTMAKERALFFLLSTQGDHKQAWLDGLTPEDELDAQLESAKDSQ